MRKMIRRPEGKINSPLQNVVWKAEISGPLMTYTSIQHYRNDSSNPVEIVYSFPLPYGKSVISKFRVTINGITREAKVYAKEESKERYEDGIESGDTPILLEITEKDFCTVSLGNIKPGETASVELEYFRLLECCDGRIRLTIPTVIDDRYASNWQDIPQNEHEITTNIFADYGCKGFIRVNGEYADAAISSPTHQLTTKRIRDGLEVQITSSLDRDIVLDIKASAASKVYLAKDESGYAALANFKMADLQQSSDLDLTVLADCSGSMYGDRMESLKACLKEFSRTLTKKDQVALIAFGSEPELLCLPTIIHFDNVDSDFESAVDELDAELGGTEMYDAMKSAVTLLPGRNSKSSILLLTDGEFWDDPEKIAQLAKEGDRRVFILGIGMAPYHNALQKIAEETGGAYESVYNKYDIESAVKRMCARMRSAVISDAKVRWNAPVQWQSETPKTLFAADLVSAFAFLSDKPETAELCFTKYGDSHVETASVLEVDVGYKLCQLAACQRMIASKNRAEVMRIGLKYSIAGPETNFFLLVERDEAEKTDVAPTLAIVPQMPAADGICYSMAAPQLSKSASRNPVRKPSRKASKAARSLDDLDSFCPDDLDSFCIDGKLPTESELDEEIKSTIQQLQWIDTDMRIEMTQMIADFVNTHADVRKLFDLVGDIYTLDFDEMIDQLEKLRDDEPELWQSATSRSSSFVSSVEERPEDVFASEIMFILCLISALNEIHSHETSWTVTFDQLMRMLEVKDAQDLKEKLGV